MKHRSQAAERGLTLLEVVLALAILAGSVATLAQLVGIGMRAAGQSRDLTQGQLLAESTLSEIAAGILPAETLNRVPVDTNPGWLISTSVENTIHAGILRVTVLIERDSESYRRTQYQLSRWIRDPSIAIPVDQQEASDTSSESSSSSSGNDSSGGDANGGGNNNGGGGGGAGGGPRGGGGRGNGGGGGGRGNVGGGGGRGNVGGGNPGRGGGSLGGRPRGGGP